MNLPISFLLNAGGLFDFDLTFTAEGILFLLLAFVVTFLFLGPVSRQLNERAEFINYTLRKSSILLTFGYEKLSECIGVLSLEISELNRQLKLTKTYTNSKFDSQIFAIQSANNLILTKLKGQLSIQSAFILSSVTPQLNTFADSFFNKKFH